MHQKAINTVNIYAQHRSAQIYKENLGGLQERDSNTLIVGDFNTPLSKMDTSSKTKNQQGHCSTERHARSNGLN